MSDPRPSILWVTQEVPDPAGGGGAIRQAALLARLGATFDVDLLVAGSVPDPVRSAVRSVVEAVATPSRPPGRARALWELGIRRRPLFLAASTRARAALRRELRARAGSYDAVVVHHEELLPLLDERAAPLRVLHVFDVTGERAEQMAAVAPTARSARVWRAEAAAARREERRWLPRADLVVACTDADLTALEEAAQGSLAAGVVVPNGVDLDAVRPTALPGGRRVLFLGSLDYEPNIDGVTWFAEAVWPTVRAAEPGATLTVAGHRPGPRVRALGAVPGVEVVGAVPDAPACVAEHDLVVVPLRIGTGSRLKALEAMAAGRPVVGTSVGLEGLAVDGAAIVADAPEELAAAIVAVLRDQGRAAALASAGRALVEERFGWDPIASALADALLAEIGPRSTARGASVLVCTRGRPELLGTALASIDAALGPEDELRVVEADGAAAAGAVARLRGPARHLVAPRPGKSRQLNLGLRAAARPVVVMTDDDCEVDAGWVQAMAAPFDDPAVGAVFGDVVGLSGVRGVDVPPLAPGQPPAVTWEYANGAAMALRREAVLALGGFDERLGPGAPLHGEEHDLVLRLQDAGWSVRIADAPPVRHLDWRDEGATRRNLLVYSRGAGAFVGAALRRSPRAGARLLARRARYQASLWRHAGAEGPTFGPATTAAFVQGLARGLTLRPWAPRRVRRAAQPRRRSRS